MFTALSTLALLRLDDDAAAAAGLLAGFACVYIVVVLAITAFFIFCLWRIFSKAGYSGAMALISLIPGLGPLICICILAFGNWPVLQNRGCREKHRVEGGGAMAFPRWPSAGSSLRSSFLGNA